MGSALVVLVRAGLVTGEIPLPHDDDACMELESLNAVYSKDLITSFGAIVCGQGENSVNEFSQTILGLIESYDIFLRDN